MRMSYGLSLEQTQKLIMTPELRQAITILQLSSIELAEYIEQEILNNPVLEIKEEESEKDYQEKDLKTEEVEKGEIDWEEYFQDSSDLGYIRNYNEQDREEYSYENFVTKAPTLQEHLMFQLHLSLLPKRYEKIGEFLIGSLDKNGYLTCATKDIADILKVDVNEVEEVLGLIQTFDPPGVGARNLQECLLIQVYQKGIKNHNLELVITNYLNELAQARYTKIADSLNITLKEVQEIKDIIQSLEPKPGRNFQDSDIQYVIPDAVIEKVGDEYIVIINDTTAPRLTINNYYKELLSSESKESSISKFLTNRLESALWLIKSIEQRRMTLYKVVKSIVDVQREFFDKGVRYLKPLTLKDIADMIGVHESTVSRATNGKYVQTPRGVYELKFFFTSGIDNVSGNTTSSECVKRMLKDIIADEDPYNPYSDQKIADLFKQKGIVVSRRTIAKYRDELNIPPSTKRKRY
ncbi:RNA polymerase sigma-54 factor [Koleobacter methoxysyntrophicus]|jgi:RNA polymerase sigma-54 factor|uniref:RNA polymerase sigma-54 factor n=1 Tax=Koleobacter methoxysyntrophicus TaxID=2751313 RepID=A0A8A0RSF8_9FIRM|nr:RNA polymerase factor sigma-54 [Koleobacter methoxysyntrophicus]NPV42690.1 RNA polymerase factor sigma-54 [Bacillota bacterium]QSQ10460.1 RNA polymerase sigma-54 factor [Koleobacter methoxysyntrophicus]